MAEPWFGEGLYFACTRCGNCCTGAPGYVWVNAEEIAQIAEYRGETADSFRLKYVRLVGTAYSLTEETSGDCAFYDRDAKGCSIYPVRPRQCRTWPFWPSNLRSRIAWEETCKVCPGASRGTFVSCGKVQSLAAVIKL